MIDLAAAKREINEESAKHDAEIQDHLDTAIAVVEEIVGPITSRTFTETVWPNGEVLVLSRYPIIALTSVVGAYGYTDTYAVSSIYTDADAGILRLGTRQTWTTSPLTVTYVAGRTVSDPRIDRAVLELFRINWRPQQGGNYSAFDEAVAAGEGSFRLGYFVPRNLEEGLLRAFNVPRIA